MATHDQFYTNIEVAERLYEKNGHRIAIGKTFYLYKLFIKTNHHHIPR